MIWHILKYYLCFVIRVFFKKFKIKNAHYLQVKGPVIIAMNHPNGFIDPIALTVATYPPRLFYLARGDAFKKGIVSVILESIGIIPIFRIQDGGKEGLKKNDETYERVNALLKKNKKIIIFAEGLCIQERRLRPLKKGVPRMIFGAMDAVDIPNLTVVPVGINYSNPSQFRGNVFFNVGEPIKMSDYYPAYKESPAKAMNSFIANLTPKMKELIVNINNPINEKVISHIEEIYNYKFYALNNLNSNNAEHEFMLSNYVANTFNSLSDEQQLLANKLALKTTVYTTQLKTLKLRDWLINPAQQTAINYATITLLVLAIVVTFPLYIVALIGNYAPYKLTEFLVNKKVKIIEFKASFLMGLGAFVFLFYYLFLFFVSKAFTSNYWYAIFIILLFVVTGWLSLHLSPLRKKTKGMLRLLKLKKTAKSTFDSLANQRKNIITDFEALC